MARLAVVGDVHGQGQALRHILARIEAHGVERCVLLGDLVDRGPESIDCVQIARTFRLRARDGRRRPLELVLGNHELNYCNAAFGRAMTFRDGSRGVPRPTCREIAAGLTADDCRWLDSQRRYISVQEGGLDLLLVHGGVKREHARVPGWLGQTGLDQLTRIGWLDEVTGEPLHPAHHSRRHWADDYGPEHGPVVIFGHTTFGPRITWFENAVGLDCSKAGVLAGLILSSEGEAPVELYEEHEPVAVSSDAQQ